MNELLTVCLETLSTKLALRNDQAGVTIIEEALKTIKAMELDLRREKARADAHYENYTEMVKRVDLWARRFDCAMQLLAEASIKDNQWYRRLVELRKDIEIWK